jgi:hypothetical protein
MAGMDPMFLLWALITAVAFTLAISVLRGGFRWARRMRVNSVWKAAGALTGLVLRPATRREPPELAGVYEDREARVRVVWAKKPRSGPWTRVLVKLRRESPLKVRVRRESSISVLGQLARVGFRPDRLDDSDVFHVEGDRGLFRDVLGAELKKLFLAEEEWGFFLTAEEVSLEHPKITTDLETIVESLQLLSRVAERIESGPCDA